MKLGKANFQSSQQEIPEKINNIGMHYSTKTEGAQRKLRSF